MVAEQLGDALAWDLIRPPPLCEMGAASLQPRAWGGWLTVWQGVMGSSSSPSDRTLLPQLRCSAPRCFPQESLSAPSPCLQRSSPAPLCRLLWVMRLLPRGGCSGGWSGSLAWQCCGVLEPEGGPIGCVMFCLAPALGAHRTLALLPVLHGIRLLRMGSGPGVLSMDPEGHRAQGSWSWLSQGPCHGAVW